MEVVAFICLLNVFSCFGIERELEHKLCVSVFFLLLFGSLYTG